MYLPTLRRFVKAEGRAQSAPKANPKSVHN